MYGKTDTDVAAVRREDGRVDTNNFPLGIKQGSTRVSAIDRGVYLDEIIKRPALDVSTPGRNDSGSGCATKTKRVAYGNYPVTDSRCIVITKTDGG